MTWHRRPLRRGSFRRRQLAPLPLLLVALTCTACAADAEPGHAVPAGTGPAPALDDAAFAALVDSISEAGGYFDTDNLISNESSYLHVLGSLRERGLAGGAYVGVGPGQSFSYVAELRPRIAFIVDVRRDNLLQHLLFKAVFESAPTRIEYLALLLGRPAPPEPDAWRDRPVEALVAWIDSVPADPAAVHRARRVVDSAAARTGIPLLPGDSATIRRFHDRFIAEGLDLRFNTHGRAPRPYYPTLRRLVLERDLAGRRSSYLAERGRYEYVRELQGRNLVVPVVGDLAGERAVRAVGDVLRSRNEAVTLLYTSNVEFYLFRAGTFGDFAENVASLPFAPGAMIARSYFPNVRGRHPHAVEGYWSTQTLQPVSDFVEVVRSDGFADYGDLVTRHAVDPRPAAVR